MSVRLHDDGGTANLGVDTSAVQTFTITVDPVNDAPTAAPITETTNEDTPKGITLLGSDPDPGDTLSYIVLTQPLHGSVTVLNAVATYTPATNWSGTDSFTYVAHDAILFSSLATVDLTVNAVNDAPSFVKGGNQTVPDGTGAQSIPGWATAISAGPADEIAQILNFIVTNDNNDLFSSQPAVAADGTLTYTPAANQSGSATVSAELHDNGGIINGGVDTSAVQTFTITVDAVAPTVIISSTVTGPTNLPSIPMTVTFTESVTGFVLGDIVVVNGSATNLVAVNGALYTFDLIPIKPYTSVTVTVDIPAGAAIDSAGNSSVASNHFSIISDQEPAAPTINQAPAQSDPTNDGTINFTAFFDSHSTYDFGDEGDVVVTGTAGGSKTVVVSNRTVVDGGITCNVAVSGMTTSGTVIVNIPAGVTHDWANNPNVASTSTDNMVFYDGTVPATASVTSPTATTYNPSTVPTSFNGSAADELGGIGLAANSTTFTLKNSLDQYWTGLVWGLAGVPYNLTSTHSATTSGGSATWTNVGRPAHLERRHLHRAGESCRPSRQHLRRGRGQLQRCQHFSLTYTAGEGGTIVGTTRRRCHYGEDGTEVVATPDLGYHFVSWSDGCPHRRPHRSRRDRRRHGHRHLRP